MLGTASAETLPAFADRFHAAVDEASRNLTLVKFLDTAMAFDPIDRKEALEDRELAQTRFKERKEIAAALAARDRDRAEALMRSHVLRGGQLIFRGLPDV